MSGRSQQVHLFIYTSTIALFVVGFATLWVEMESIRLWAGSPDGIVVFREVVAIMAVGGLVAMAIAMVLVWFD